jgi:hypothetical protein
MPPLTRRALAYTVAMMEGNDVDWSTGALSRRKGK